MLRRKENYITYIEKERIKLFKEYKPQIKEDNNKISKINISKIMVKDLSEQMQEIYNIKNNKNLIQSKENFELQLLCKQLAMVETIANFADYNIEYNEVKNFMYRYINKSSLTNNLKNKMFRIIDQIALTKINEISDKNLDVINGKFNCDLISKNSEDSLVCLNFICKDFIKFINSLLIYYQTKIIGYEAIKYFFKVEFVN